METAITNPEGALGQSPTLGSTRYPFVAGAAVVANTAVALGDDGVIPATATTPVLGIATTAAAASGDVVEVVVHGEASATASATVTAGANVLTDANAKVKAGAAASSLNVGIALEDGDAADLVRIWVNPS